MNLDGRSIRFPPFSPEYRASGMLLHVTSLSSPYGIGDVGPTALAWIDRLQEAGQTWWQALPLGPTGYGDSPYQSLSSFAGNGLLISLEWLTHDLLCLRAEGRMNVPGQANGNWRWRCTEDVLAAPAFQWLRKLTEAFGRTDFLQSLPENAIVKNAG
jgi:4-alpha-glucanotransferase